MSYQMSPARYSLAPMSPLLSYPTENTEGTQEMDVDDLARCLPFMNKLAKNDQQKAAVQKYFKEKVTLIFYRVGQDRVG